jgi:hypothetical protein
MKNQPTVSAKYVFLDIVRYSDGRHIEAQIQIIKQLNQIVLRSLREQKISTNQTTFLPTGDGICIAIHGIGLTFDCHLLLALKILRLINAYNISIKEKMYKFYVRIGLNENTDNWITDINGNQNIAGKGINLAQRIMEQGDGSQIMVGRTTYETLSQRKKYYDQFEEYYAVDKHNIKFPVYQFKGKGVRLNRDVSAKFEKIPLNELVSKIIGDEERLSTLEVIYAVYGSSENSKEATMEVKNRIKNNKLEIVADNSIVGDPDSGNPDKWLYVLYSLNGSLHLKYKVQGDTLEIPPKRVPME